MLEGIGTYLINYYLGEFLEDINNDQLSVQFLSGEINLANVPIRRGASERFGLPIHISGGNVGNIKIIRPSATRFFLDPFVIEISGLQVELQPSENKTNESTSAEDVKFRRLQSLISRWLAVGQQQGLWASYSNSIISEIVQNIQVTISDVSITYRDNDLLLNRHIDFNIAQIKVANVLSTLGFAHKRLHLSNLEIVWNYEKDSEHVMEPVDATIDIVKNRCVTPLLENSPRFKVDLSIGDVSFQLSDKQHFILYSTWEKLEWFYRKQLYCEHRPHKRISDVDPSERTEVVQSWWKWLLHHTAHPIQEYRRTKTKAYLVDRVIQLNLYSKIIAKLLKKMDLTSLDIEKRLEIETKWSYDECRTVIYAVVDKLYHKRPKGDENLEGWGSWMMRGGGLFRGRTDSDAQRNESEMNPENPDPGPSIVSFPKLALKTQTAPQHFLPEYSVTNDSFLTRDEHFADLCFKLSSGVLKLNVHDERTTSHSKSLSRIEFSGLHSSLNCKFRSDAFTYIIELEDFKVFDDFTNDTIYPTLVSTVGSKLKKSQQSMFHFSFEKVGLYQRMYVETAPLTVIYNKPLMDRAKGFFNLKGGGPDRLHVWRQRERYRGVKEEAKRNISKALSKVMSINTGGVNVTLDLCAPKIVMPQDFSDLNSPQILIDLGRIKFSNVEENDVEEVERFFTPESTPPSEPASAVEMESTMIDAQELHERLLVSKIYHKYSVQLLDLQILVGKQNDAWRAASAAKKSSMHVVESFNVSVGIEKRAFDVVDDTKYPMVMISGSLPALTLHVNESKTSIIFSCMDSFGYGNPPQSEERVDIPIKASASENLRKLIVIMFQIDRVTCGLASVMYNDQTIAAIEVTRIKAEIKLMPEKHHLKVSIGSVIVADCYERLGPDFEFILVSNKNTTLDIPSGTIIDSGCTSPAVDEQRMQTPPNFVSKLTENLLTLLNPSDIDSETQSSWSHQSEELAVFEWTHYDDIESSDIGDDFHVKFSSLDLVITPNTLSVLLHLLHRLKPPPKAPKVNMNNEKVDNNNKDRLTVVHFEMSTINFMAACSEQGMGRKIATAGIEDFRSVVQMQNPGNVNITGRIGSIFGSDLSIAKDQHFWNRTTSTRIFALGTPKIKDLEFDKIFHNAGNDAFSFELKRQNVDDDNYQIAFDLEMASLCYMHSPRFLGQVVGCLDQFKMEFDKKLTSQAQAMYQEALSGLYQKVADVAIGPAPSMADCRLNLKFKSPFVVLPKQFGSSEMLLAKIGSIRVHNQGLMNFAVEISDGAVSSIYNNFGSVLEQRGVILEKTDVNIKFDLNDDQISVQVNFPARPILSVTKMNYEQILKTLDNLAIPDKTPKSEQDEDKLNESSFKPLHFIIHIPAITIDLKDEADRNTVKFIFYEIRCQFDKCIPTVFTCDLGLGAIEAIDAESPHEFMLRSRRGCPSRRRSTSWPSCSPQPRWMLDKRLSSNLLMTGPAAASKTPGKFVQFFHDGVETLVKIQIRQENQPDRFGDRQIKIKISRLDAGINLQTWVTLIDFLTPSCAPLDRVTSATSSQSDGLTAQARSYRRQVIENQGTPVNTRIEFDVENFTIIFNKPEYQFAKASIQGLSMRLTLLEKTHRYTGSLAQLTLYDLSPAGHLYRERFVTASSRVLNFDIFRYSQSDPGLEREWDIRVKLKMSQIVYIHTHRFQSELIAYFLHFHQLLELVNHYRAALVGAEVNNIGRGSRVKLDITADNPTLLLPESSHTNKIIIADLGKLSVSNSFHINGDPATLNFNTYKESEYPKRRVLLDCITVGLKEMDIWVGDRRAHHESGETDIEFDDFKIVRHKQSLLYRRVMLSLAIERNLQQNLDRSVPDMHIKGVLSKAHFVLNREQFWVVRGFLDHNLGEMQPVYERPSMPVNLEEAMTETVMTGEVFRNLRFHLGLKNVTVELGEVTDDKLVKMEFVDSVLNFEALSNNHKHTSLVCAAFNAWDCRKLYNIHPTFQKVIAANLKDQKIDQIELVFKATPDGASFKVVTEKTRIIVLPEWSKQTLSYLLDHPDPDYGDSIRKQNFDLIKAARQDISNPGSTKESGENSKQPLDITINIHGTQFLIINDLTTPESAAITLKSTAVLHKSDLSTMLSLQCLELFSCELSNEEQTSLSILDPTSLSLELSTPEEGTPKLEASFNEIMMRLSYTDFLLIRSIAQNLQLTLQGEPDGSTEQLKPPPIDADGSVVIKEGDKEVTFWRAYPLVTQQDEDIVPVKPSLSSLPEGSACLSGKLISMTLIDDSGERDIPLIEMELKDIDVKFTNEVAKLTNTFVVFLFNQSLSIWEPVIEPYRLLIRGDRGKSGYNIQLLTESRLNLNVTPNLFQLITRAIPRLGGLISGSSVRQLEVRKKFRPYTLHNSTGFPISYTTSGQSWLNLDANSQDDFKFANHHEKIRIYQQKSHRIWLRVDTWLGMEPVTVNKVGTFFRHAIHPSKPPIRIVIEVSLTDSARKMVIIRSAVKVISNVGIPIEIFHQSHFSGDGTPIDVKSMGVIEPHSSMLVALQHVDRSFIIRPCNKLDHSYSETSMSWRTTRQRQFYVHCNPKVNTDRCCTFHCRIDALKFPSGTELRATIEELYRREKIYPLTDDFSRAHDMMPGHDFFIFPGTVIKNLLPSEVHFNLSGYSGTIQPHEEQELFFAPDEMKFKIMMEGFDSSSEVLLPRDREVLTEIRIVDQNRRLLLLNVRVRVYPRIVISISARYWLINHTSLPLVLRQFSSSDAAGQFDEHERARCRTPLLFSYSDTEYPNYCQLRLGLHRYSRAYRNWTTQFCLDDDCHRELPGENEKYQLGISVRNGTEDYRDTRIVTFTPRFTIQNSTNFELNFSQQYLVFGLWQRDPDKYVTAQAGASCNFHWPDATKEKYLCVRGAQPISTRWSGGFSITTVNTTYLNLRVGVSDMIFLEVSVSYHAAMFFIELRELKGAAPLIRIDNLSAVPVTILQKDCKDASVRVEVPAESSLPYVCDEPMLPEIVVCSVKSAKKTACVNFSELDSVAALHYENLFYLTSRELVLDIDGGKKIFVTRKEMSRRSQLWRIDSRGTLVNANAPDLVLDPTSLKLVRTNERTRIHTWSFIENHLCFGSRRLYLNHLESPIFLTKDQIQAVDSIELTPFEKVRLLKGSGQLELRVVRDGPSRVLQILDIVQSQAGTSVDSGCLFVESADERHYIASATMKSFGTRFCFGIDMPSGMGISAVAAVANRKTEELFYLHCTGISLHFELKRNSEKHMFLTIHDIQGDNQLDGGFPRVMLQKNSRANADTTAVKPALALTILTLPNAENSPGLFRLLKIETAPLSINLDEGLILRCLLLAEKLKGHEETPASFFTKDPQSLFLREMRANATITRARYYFEEISIKLDELHTSLYKQSELPTDVKLFKARQPISLVQFEDARIIVEQYYSRYTFKDIAAYQNDYISFTRACLKSQAYKILGSVDFLGNPLGLAHDIKDGLDGVMKHGDLTSIIQGTTRGMANSASKFFGSVADVMSSFTADPTYEDARRRRRNREHGEFGSVVDGLAYGIVGGVTSVVSQTYRGIRQDGAAGLITGLSKGVVGTLVKPMTGVLDFATGTASIIREKADGRSKCRPNRPPRLVSDVNGGLPIYDESKAHAQTILREIDSKSRERLFIVEKIKSALLMFITESRVLVYGENFENIVHVSFDKIIQVVAYKNRLVFDLDKQRPAIECETDQQAIRLKSVVMSVWDLYRDEQHTLNTS